MTQRREKARAAHPLHKSFLWRIAAVTALPILILVFGTIFVLRNFNPNRYAPALVTAIEQATGRHVTLNGKVDIHWSLTPAIQANGITIDNPPGFTGPPMLTLGALRAEVALFPLFSHHLDILRLVLIDPHLNLERLPDGRANWNLSKTSHRAGIMPLVNGQYKLALEAVEIKNGSVMLRTSKGNVLETVQFTRLIGTAASLSAPLHLIAQAQIGNTPFTLKGVVGSLERFSGTGSGPWPLDLDMALANATLGLTGTIAHPRDATGYSLTAQLKIPNLAVLGQALFPGLADNQPLPPLQNIAAVAEIKDRGAALPAINNLSITAGQTNLSTLRPGLVLDELNIQMPALSQPVSFAASGTSDSGAFKLQGKLGSVQRLFNPAWLPADAAAPGNFPVSLTAQLGQASASITGAIATPHNLSGAALAITANIPNLSTFSALVGTTLPAWKNISLQATLVDPGGAGLYNIAGLDDLAVTMDNAAFGGAATLDVTPHPKLQLSLNFTQVNLDALLAAFPTQTLIAPKAPPASIPIAPVSTTPAHIIPDTPLPLGFVSWGNDNIQINANNLTWNGADYTAVQANIQLSDKVLTISPITGETPGGNVSASARLDGSQTPPAESLSIKAPALALGPLLKALKQPGQAQGNAQLTLSATSQGDNLHQIAANLNGQLGVASVNDTLDSSLLNHIFGSALQTAGLPLFTASPASIRCLGVLVNANKGLVTLDSFGLDAGQVQVQGTGNLDLGQESYAISLQFANGKPVVLGGSFAEPAWAPGPTPLEQQESAPTQHPDICPTTLAAARLGQAGPVPAPPTIPALTAPASASAPKNLLNSLTAP